MKRPGASHFLAASVAAHVVLGAILLAIRPRDAPASPRTIVVEVRRRLPAAAAPAPATPPPATAPEPSPPVTERPAPRPIARRPPASPAPPPPAPQPAPPPPQQAPVAPEVARKPDLFDRRALESVTSGTGVVGVLRQNPSLGTTRSAQRGDRDPNQRDALADGEHASGVLNEMIGDVRRRDDAAKGKVAPRWREAERAMQNNFAPAPDVITTEGSVAGFLKSWANTRPSGGTTPRGVDDSQGGPGGFLGTGAAGAAPGEIPDHLKARTVIEVVLAADGSVVSAEVKVHSGRRLFDQQARQLVVDQLKNRGPLDDNKGIVMRWAVDAWVNVAPPSPVAGFSFDEVRGVVKANHPFKKDVGKRVSLLSVRTLQ